MRGLANKLTLKDHKPQNAARSPLLCRLSYTLAERPASVRKPRGVCGTARPAAMRQQVTVPAAPGVRAGLHNVLHWAGTRLAAWDEGQPG